MLILSGKKNCMKLLRLHGCTHSYHNRIVSHSYFIAIKARPIRFLGHLVGGFNPFEKYSSKWAHLPQFSGWKYWSIGNHLLDEQFMSVEHPNHPGTFLVPRDAKKKLGAIRDAPARRHTTAPGLSLGETSWVGSRSDWKLPCPKFNSSTLKKGNLTNRKGSVFQGQAVKLQGCILYFLGKPRFDTPMSTGFCCCTFFVFKIHRQNPRSWVF